jgi:hypothetical protein
VKIDSGLEMLDAVIFQKPESGAGMKFVLQSWQMILLI